PAPPSPLFYFTDAATTHIYTLSLHDALPISGDARSPQQQQQWDQAEASLLEGLYQMAVDGRTETSECSRLASDVYRRLEAAYSEDRKSTRLNSSHVKISYAVFCLKKKTNHEK